MKVLFLSLCILNWLCVYPMCIFTPTITSCSTHWEAALRVSLLFYAVKSQIVFSHWIWGIHRSRDHLSVRKGSSGQHILNSCAQLPCWIKTSQWVAGPLSLVARYIIILKWSKEGSPILESHDQLTQISPEHKYLCRGDRHIVKNLNITLLWFKAAIVSSAWSRRKRHPDSSEAGTCWHTPAVCSLQGGLLAYV